MLDSLKPITGVDDRLLSCEASKVKAAVGDEVEALCRAHGFRLSWRCKPPNLGLHLDELHAANKDYMLYVQDDFEFTGTSLDLRPGAELLRSGAADIVKYFWEPYKCKELAAQARGPFLQLPPGFVSSYSDNPHMVHRKFWDAFGPFGLGVNGTGQEQRMDHKVRAAGVKVFCNMPVVFKHIGKHSIQKHWKVWPV